MVKCQHMIKSILLGNLPGTFSLDNYTCNCMSIGKTYSLQCFFFFFQISIKLLQSWDSPREKLNVFFLSFVVTLTLYLVRFPTTGQICIHTTMNAFHLFSLQLYTNVHHFECCAYFTIFICNIYGWRSCTWKCIKWCIEPPTPLPPIRVCIFSLNWSHHMHHCHVL